MPRFSAGDAQISFGLGAFYVFMKENEGDNVAIGGKLLSDR